MQQLRVSRENTLVHKQKIKANNGHTRKDVNAEATGHQYKYFAIDRPP